MKIQTTWLCRWIVALGLVSAGFAQSPEDIRNTLRFGLESQVLDTLRQLSLQKDATFVNEALANLEPYQSPAVREAVVRYLTEIQRPLEEEQLAKLFQDAESWPTSLTLTVADHLASLKLHEAFRHFEPLLESESLQKRGAAIRLAGRLERKELADRLLGLLKDPQTPTELLGDLIVALGRLGAQEADEEIARILEDGTSSAALRTLCLEALSYLDTPRAHQAFTTAFQSENALVRAAAVRHAARMKSSTLPPEVYLRALRDNTPSVRLAAAEALQDHPLSETREMLVFRAERDPDPKVQEAALRALRALDEGTWKQKLLSLLRDRRGNSTLWQNLIKEVFERRVVEALTVLRQGLQDDLRLLAAPSHATVAQQWATFDWPEADTLLEPIVAGQNSAAQTVILRAIQQRNRRDLRPLVERLRSSTRHAAPRQLAEEILRSWNRPLE